ncbi:MAG: PEP-CTERM sorting domain-containing protein [Pirellulaceae bacterium]
MTMFSRAAAVLLTACCISPCPGDVLVYDNSSGPLVSLSGFSSAGELINFDNSLAGLEVFQLDFGIALPAAGTFDFEYIVEFWDTHNASGTPVHEDLLSAFIVDPNQPFTVVGTATGLITSDDLRPAGLSFVLPDDGKMFFKYTIVDKTDGLQADPATEATVLLSRGGVSIGDSPDSIYLDQNGDGILGAGERFDLPGDPGIDQDNIRLTLHAAAVPEPGSVVLLCIAAVALVTRRRR